jgi:peptide/nickel transport system permease protein
MSGANTGFVRRFSARWPAVAGLVVLTVIVVVAVIGPLFYPTDPWSMVSSPFAWPAENPQFPLGTDALGRDVLAGVIHGAGITLLIGVTAAGAAVLLGGVLGAVAGYFRGMLDDALMRLTEVFQTIPTFIFLIVLVAILGPSIATIVGAIATVSWPPIARMTRAEFLSLREREFIQACHLLGMGHLRIMFLQILPNAIAPIAAFSSILVANAILSEAALSFLGLGDPNVITWGAMIGLGRESLRTAWFLCAIPGIAILVTVLAINLVGDGLGDALNPKVEG